ATDKTTETPPVKTKSAPKKLGIKERLTRIFVALTNCLKAPILAKLASRGYTAEKITALLTIHSDVTQLDEAKDTAYKTQLETTEELDNLADKVKKNYGKLRRLAKVALTGQDATLRALGLTTKQKTSLSGLVGQIKLLYLHINTDDVLLAKLAETGITREEVAAELPLLDELDQLNVRQEFEKKQAQKATELRDARMDELEKGFYSLNRVGHVVLEDDKQFLELLSIG
ncbi:MAG: hypothetical protein GY765_34755, partial [bacterium]|nr:hypothetical protein [bacterium]